MSQNKLREPSELPCFETLLNLTMVPGMVLNVMAFDSLLITARPETTIMVACLFRTDA